MGEESSGQSYICPTCNEEIERDLLLFLRHTDMHIIDCIKAEHPGWEKDDGTCPKCEGKFRDQLGRDPY